MKTIGLVAAAAIIAAGAGYTAYAAGGMEHGEGHGMMRGGGHGMGQGRMMERMFDRFDANEDGKIEQSEIDSAHAGRFSESDADGDGALSTEEIKAMVMKRAETRADRMAERMLNRMDEDGDGSISQAEFNDAHGGRAARMM